MVVADKKPLLPFNFVTPVSAPRRISKASGNISIVIIEGMDDIKTVTKELQGEGINAKWYQVWKKLS